MSSTSKWQKLRLQAFARDGFRCLYCGDVFPTGELVPDHITPVADGGKDELSNLATACWRCNNLKGRGTLDDLADKLARKRDGRPFFNAAQIAYLRRFDIEIPKGEPYVFWFERKAAAA